MLGCEIEDVQHWLMVGAMKGYVKASCLENDGSHLSCVARIPVEFMRDKVESVKSSCEQLGFDSLDFDHIYFMSPDECIGTFSSLGFQYHLKDVVFPNSPHEVIPEHLCLEDGFILDEADVKGKVSFGGFVEICCTYNFERIFAQGADDEPITLRSLVEPEGMSFSVEYDGAINPGDIYILREDLLRVYKSLNDNPEQPLVIVGERKKNDSKKNRTSENTKLRALGTMAYLIAKKVPSRMHGSKPNADGITDLINKELSLLKLDNVSNEIRKDISDGVKLILEEIPDASNNS